LMVRGSAGLGVIVWWRQWTTTSRTRYCGCFCWDIPRMEHQMSVGRPQNGVSDAPTSLQAFL
jgi:hypothetical protein